MSWPRAGSLRAEDITVGLAGAALLLPIEIVLLSRTPTPGFQGAAWAVAALFGALAVLVGLSITAGSALADRLARPALTPWVRAFPALLALIPASKSLFDGAFAATLPGARLGFLWAPVVGLALVALAVYVGGLVASRPLGRAGLGIALPGIAIELDLFNRTLLASEYADLHTLVLVTSTVLGGVGLRLLVDTFRPLGWQWPMGAPSRRLTGTVGGTAAFAALALVAGLGDKASRRVIADEGMHGRLLDRVAKSIFDFDGDGHAKVLGGDDCAELNASVHPEAREVAGNGVDEDCDGTDDAGGINDAAVAARRKRIAEWRQTAEVDGFVRRLSRLNVMLVAVDALRADPFAPTQENAAAFPNVFALRRRATWFTHAFSTAAGTDLSMTGVMTARINPLGGAELTVAEALGAAGYRTHAVIPAEVLRAAGRTLLTRGFQAVDVIDTDGDKRGPATTSADHTVERALGFIDGWKKSPPQGPFFLWTHFFDVHEHYQLPSTAPALIAHNHGVAPRNRAEKYRTLVSVVDGAIGRLRAGLAARGLADNTAIILLSDHGESLHEDRRLPENHGRFLYNALTHVPLAIIMPGVEPGELNHPVSLLDVPATLLDVVGATADAGEIEGESLLPLLLGAPPTLLDPPRLLPLNESDQFGIIAWPHKLMVRPDANLVELYDLSRDFTERNDLAEAQPELVRWLTHSYHSLPGLKLDRTNVARRRWETKAEATRPSLVDLERIGKGLRAKQPDSAGNDDKAPWRPGQRPMALASADGKRGGTFLGTTRAGPVRELGRVGERATEEIASGDDQSSVHAGIVIEPLPRRKTWAERRRERRQAIEARRARRTALLAEAAVTPASVPPPGPSPFIAPSGAPAIAPSPAPASAEPAARPSKAKGVGKATGGKASKTKKVGKAGKAKKRGESRKAKVRGSGAKARAAAKSAAGAR